MTEPEVPMTYTDAPIVLRIQPLGHAPFTLSAQPSSLLSDLRTEVARRLDGGRIRLLFSGQQLLRGTLHAAGLKDGSAVTVLRTPESAVTKVRALREDRLLKPFNAPAPKYTATPLASRCGPSLFDDIEVLPQFEDWREAERILRDLADDTGFHYAMAKRGWRVGKLAEMYPSGRVGIDPVCVLGYNVGKGMEIHLRLRTDDLAGFRSMTSIRQVLAHELAHNVHSDHGDAFKALMMEVEREANAKDWRQSRGRVVGDAGLRGMGAFPSRPMAAYDGVSASAGGSRLLREDAVRKQNARRAAEAAAGDEAGSAGGGGGEHASQGLGAERCASCGVGAEGTHGNKSAVSATPDASAKASEPKGCALDASSDASGQANASLETFVLDKPGEPPSGTVEEAKAAPVDANDKQPPAEDPMEIEPKVSPPVNAPKKQKPATKVSPQVQALGGMGFAPGIARLALRENDNDPTRAADWILSRMSEPDSVPERAGDDTIRLIVDALARLEKETETEDQFCVTLDTLHAYFSNVLRNPGNARYRQINGANANFQRRVAEFQAAVDILHRAGFLAREGEAMLRLRSEPDMAKLWTAKTIVQERLVKEFLS